MDLDSINVLAWIHSKESGPNEIMRLSKNSDHSITMSNIDGKPGYPRQARYAMTECYYAPSSVETCQKQAQQLASLAVQGYNTAAAFVSVGESDPFQHKIDTMHSIIQCLDAELTKANRHRTTNGQSTIELDYAYLGITDDDCYDINNVERIDNAYVLANGLSPFFTRVNQVNEVWADIKRGCKFPYIIKLRLTDAHTFLGTLVLCDLYNPKLMASASMSLRHNFHYSLSKLKDIVTAVADPDYTGPMATDNNVLTKLLSEYFCGKSKCIVFMHFDEHSKYIEETHEALVFSQLLQKIRCTAMKNLPDDRIDEYIQLLTSEKQKHIHTENRLKGFEVKLKAANSVLLYTQNMCKEHEYKYKYIQQKYELVTLEQQVQKYHETILECDYKRARLQEENDFRETRVELLAYKRRMDSMEYSSLKTQERLNTKEDQTKELVTTNTQLQKDYDELASKHRALETSNSEMKSKVLELKEEVSDLKSELKIKNDRLQRSFVNRRVNDEQHRLELSMAQSETEQYRSQMQYYRSQSSHAFASNLPMPAMPSQTSAYLPFSPQPTLQPGYPPVSASLLAAQSTLAAQSNPPNPPNPPNPSSRSNPSSQTISSSQSTTDSQPTSPTLAIPSTPPSQSIEDSAMTSIKRSRRSMRSIPRKKPILSPPTI